MECSMNFPMYLAMYKFELIIVTVFVDFCCIFQFPVINFSLLIEAMDYIK